MHRLVPPFILQQLAAAGTHGSFSAASLFVDVSGFSTITDALMQHGQHGAEVLAEAMRAVLDPLVHAVYAQAGFVAFFAGDALTALFSEAPGSPPALPRALAAAWAMQQLGETHRETPYGPFTFSVKIGLAYGAVDWGILAAPAGRRHIYYFRGAAIDGCAHAEHAARRGQVLLSAPARAALGTSATVEPVDPGRFRLLAVAPDLPAPREVVQPPADPAATAAFFPLEIVTQELPGEFRPVVNLFLGLPDPLPDPQLAAVMAHIFALQERYGGLLNHVDFGDKGCTLLFFWGAPTAFENDVERALNFSLDLQAAAPMPLRAGLTYRIAHAGFVGSSLQEEYACYGRGVNLAARLMAAAPWGEVWVDEPAAHRAGGRFALRPLGARSFKGFAQPQSILVLQGRQVAAGPLYRGEMVGRAAELGRLEEFVRPLERGHYAGVLLVQGEAGLGKSRLLHEFRQALARRVPAVRWFLAPADEIVRSSLNPFRYWLRGYFEQQGAGAGRKARFQEILAALIARTPDPALQAELQRTHSFLGTLVDLSWPGSLYEQLEPALRFQNTLAALVALLRAEALSGPVVLQLEDAQWLDADSQEGLRYLTRVLALAEEEGTVHYPVALLGTARPPEPGVPGPDLAAPGTPLEVLDLPTLVEDEAGRLAEDILRQKLAPPLRTWLATRADGNPFFVEQLALYLREQGLLIEGSAGAELAAGAGVQVPADVRAVLVARLDRLSAEVKRVVQTAAVLGREFEVVVLSAMLREEERVAECIRAAEQEAIWAALSQIRYLFHHALLRDSAYEMQLQARRRELHALALGAIETIYAAELAPHYADLAHHAEQSQDPVKQRLYYARAGAAAQAAYRNAEAQRYYELLLPLLDEVQEQIDWRLALGEVLRLVGRWEAAEQRLQEALALAERERDHARIARCQVALADILAQRGSVDAALALFREAHGHWATAGDVAGMSTALRMIGRYQIVQGNLAAAQRCMEESLALARRSGDRQNIAHALEFSGILAKEQGEYAAARVFFQEGLQLAEQLGNKRRMASMLNSMGGIAMEQNDYVVGKQLWKEALALVEETGERARLPVFFNCLAIAAVDHGDLPTARSYAQQSLAIAREIGDKIQEPLALRTLADVAFVAGDYAQARLLFEKSLALYREMKARPSVAEVLSSLGVAFYNLGDYAASRACHQEALRLAREINDKAVIAGSLQRLAIVALAQGDAEVPLSLFQEALALYQEQDNKEGTANLLNYLGLLASSRGEHAVALEHATKSLAISQKTENAMTAASGGTVWAVATARAGAARQAVRLSSALAALLAARGISLEPIYQSAHEQALVVARAALDDDEFAAAWAEGQGLAWETLIDQLLSSGPRKDHTSSGGATANPMQRSAPP